MNELSTISTQKIEIIVYTYRIMSKQTTRASMVSSGSHFMKGTSINFLRKVCKNEKNAKAKIRLKAAILRKQNIPYSVICASLYCREKVHERSN